MVLLHYKRHVSGFLLKLKLFVSSGVTGVRRNSLKKQDNKQENNHKGDDTYSTVALNLI